jgi:stage V sporulation protein R
MQKLFEVREADRDVSFLRRHLTEDLMRELHLFEHEAKGDDLVVSHVADAEGWRHVKETLLVNIGMGGTPVIKVTDSDYGQKRTLYLVHGHDGRDLQIEYAEKTLAYVHRLWQRDVALETVVDGKRTLLLYGERGLSTKTLK